MLPTRTRRSLAASVLALLLAPLAAMAAPAPVRRVVLVSIDGMRPSSYLDPDAHGLKVPVLRALAAGGAWARAVVGVLPTNTYPSHTTLSTGVPPRLHGILSNRIFDPSQSSNDAWYWYADQVKVPTLATAMHAAGLSVASISWPVTIGLRVDDLFPEFWRTGSSNPADLELLRALSTPGLISGTEADLGRPLDYPITDADRTSLAIHALRTLRPRLLLLHIQEVDHFEHIDGIDSPPAKAAMERDDADLGRLRAALAELGLARETLFVVVSDHGFLPTRTYLHPNARLRDAGLLTLDEKGKVKSWRAIFWTQGGSALLRLADPRDAATLERVRAIFAAEAARPDSGIDALLDAKQVEALGGDPERTPFALDAKPEFSFAFSPSGDWATPAIDVAGHGFAPTHPELAASLVLAGPGLARHGDLGSVPMTAIAPTLARYLGVKLDPRAGAARDWLATPARSRGSIEHDSGRARGMRSSASAAETGLPVGTRRGGAP